MPGIDARVVDLLPVVAAAQAARDGGDPAELEESRLRLAGAVAAMLARPGRRPPPPSRSDERRISAALHRIERDVHEPLSLAGLAGVAAMSPYHFLRTFRAVVGMTPHQYILHTRLHRAAVRLRRPTDSISAIAFDAGFNDLLDVQSPVCAHHGHKPERLSCVGCAAVKKRGG